MTAWKDNLSDDGYESRDANNTTVNAAILTGAALHKDLRPPSLAAACTICPGCWRTGTRRPRRSTLNTAIMNLFNSKIATRQFVNPGTYYDPPTRQFSYDLNFQVPADNFPEQPCALVLVRLNWACSPPNTITYNVTP